MVERSDMDKLQGDELLLRLDKSERIKATDFANFLNAIAKDYKKFTRGKELIVSRLASGSLLAYFREKTSFVKDNKRLHEFAASLGHFVGSARSGKDSVKRELSRKTPVVRTIESVLKLAKESGSRVQIRHSAFGEEVEINIEPSEVSRLKNTITTAKEEYKVESDIGISLVRSQGPDIGELTRRLIANPQADGHSEKTLRTIAAALLANSLGHVIEDIALQLEEAGHIRDAEILRDVKNTNRNSEPPLLSG